MISVAIVVLLSGYITYLGIVRPVKAATLLRFFSIDAAIQTDETKIDKLSEMADKYYQTRDLMAAEKAYLRVLKLDHRNFTAYYRLGLIYSYLNNNSDALECFELAAQIRPTATTLHNYGMTLFRYRDYVKAASVLERANTKTPSLARHVTLARIYRIQDNTDKQLEHLSAAAKLEKTNTEVLMLLGSAYVHADRKLEATKAFRRIIQLDPSNTQARQQLDQLAA